MILKILTTEPNSEGISAALKRDYPKGNVFIEFLYNGEPIENAGGAVFPNVINMGMYLNAISGAHEQNPTPDSTTLIDQLLRDFTIHAPTFIEVAKKQYQIKHNLEKGIQLS